MKNWTMTLSVPVEFGAGSVEKLANHLRGYEKVLIVTGRSAMKAAGVTERVCALLKSGSIEPQVYDRISPDPDHAEVEDGADLARRFGAQAVVGLGGGSAIDAAKAIAVSAAHPGPILDYRGGGTRQITARTLPIVAVSATSGTGSHVGRIAVISDRRGRVKRPLFSDFLYPRAAVCDAEILRTMPPAVTAATGFDAFAHALEGFLSRVENPMGVLCAREAIGVIYRTLPEAIRRGDDLGLRDTMAWGDTLAGISLATNGVTIPHVIGMVLGGRYGITHGSAVASVTVACLKHSRSGAVGKLATLARELGGPKTSSEESLADWAISAIERFVTAIGLGTGPGEHGVPEAELADVAAEVHRVFTVRVEADPVPTDPAGLAKILHRAAERK